MVKHVFDRINKYPVALAILGWLAFVCGVVLGLPVVVKLLLLSVARVLP